MTMDYSPWSEREIWPFLKVAISPKLKKLHPPKLVCMHLTLTPTCMNFFSRFQSIQFFDDHESRISTKPDKLCPPKLVCMHLTSIPTSMNFLSLFQSIEFFDDHGLYGQKGKFGRF